MSKKPASRLGRGLSSLLSLPSLEESPSSGPDRLTDLGLETVDESRLSESPAGPSATVTSGPAILDVRVADVARNPHQPRRSFDDASLQQLALSLATTGMVQPIVVRPLADGYELIAGERRLRAARLAGLATVPAIVRSVEPAQQAELALVENVHREDLNPMDRARAYRELMQLLALTQQALAARLGEDRSTVANHLRLLDLAQPVQEAIRDGKLTLGHAKLLAGLPDLLRQQELADKTIDEQLSVRQLEALLSIVSKPLSPAKPDFKVHLVDLEKQITAQLGLRVQVRRGGKGKGRVVIHYGSLDQFDELLSRLSIQIQPS